MSNERNDLALRARIDKESRTVAATRLVIKPRSLNARKIHLAAFGSLAVPRKDRENVAKLGSEKLSSNVQT